MMGFWDRFSEDTLIAAHRGYRAVRAENTLSAFEASLGKCDFIELDVGFSKDGIPVIIHDDTLERTSDAAQRGGFAPPYTVIDYPYTALQELDFSSWFTTKDPFGTIASGSVDRGVLAALPIQHILTLAEALSFCKQHQLPVNVEIKDMSDTPFDTLAVPKTLAVIEELGMEAEVLLSSFNHDYIAQVGLLSPCIERAILQEHAHPENLIIYLAERGVQCYHSDIKIVTEALVRELTEEGIIVNVYTVNTPEEKARMFSYGVKSVFTDFLL